MKISAKTEYAAIAAVELARRNDAREPVRIRTICEAQGVPARFLVHILLQLKAAGIVTSTRGVGGGYRLAREPGAITLRDVHQAVEGAAEATGTVTRGLARRSRAAAVLASAWSEATRAESDALASITLADLVDRCRVPGESMYYI
jgi:Rrf2 family protein